MLRSTGKKKAFILNMGIVLSVLVLSLIVFSCDRKESYYFDNLLKMEKKGYKGQKSSKRSIEELKKGIKKYRKEAERTVRASEQLGIYYKMLAVKYMYEKMYGEAAASLKKALAIYPENPILFYLTGVCYGYLSRAQVEESERDSYILKAEKYYKHALNIDPAYSDALYGLSILYTFELNKPEKALPLLKRLLKKEKENTDAMFVLARVYYDLSQYERAVEIYNRIIKSSTSKIRKNKALVDKEKVEAEIYGKK